MQTEIETKPLEKVEAGLREGMSLAKCRKCGCMKDALDALSNSLTNVEKNYEGGFSDSLLQWKSQMEPIKYACLGCEYCYPAVALNEFSKVFPDAAPGDALSCAFDVKEQVWPAVPGEYKVLCENGECPVAISTLASAELTGRIAELNPEEVCIVGKTETENIGIDKLIKNTITNKAIRFLVLAGTDPKGHKPGQTILSLSVNGVDEKMRVIGSEGKRPFLRNVTKGEIESFRRQVDVIDLIGCQEVETILNKAKDLLKTANASGREMEQPKVKCSCSTCSDGSELNESMEVPTIQAKEPTRIQMDRAGYFVILPLAEKGIISVEHYSYDDKLLRTIEGKDARSLYWTIVENNWVTQLSHAAYLGKELEKAELSLKIGFKYTQDGA
ncbi:MAG: DUF4346 domain-containing protein [Bacteroidetes bacterium]|nr:DUF4346 domain-containing protein [Bacteroidota bacterium]MCL5738028.1 DUF4346 domain-containing protein [Bacteroidota bacterium]